MNIPPSSKLVGMAAAFAAAVLFYRSTYRGFSWLFNAGVFQPLGFVIMSVLAVALLGLAVYLLPSWRTSFGVCTLFFAAWTVIYLIPSIHRRAWIGSYYSDRWDFVNSWTSWCTAVVLGVVSIVALRWESIRRFVETAWLQRR